MDEPEGYYVKKNKGNLSGSHRSGEQRNGYQRLESVRGREERKQLVNRLSFESSNKFRCFKEKHGVYNQI
jgi:hypothetical protein